MTRTALADHGLVGTWRYDVDADEWSGTEAAFTVAVRDGAFHVSGVDQRDGEGFAITKTHWDGEWLRFESLMPSTGWRVRHAMRYVGRGRAEHEVTLFETWRRARPEVVGRNKASSRGRARRRTKA